MSTSIENALTEMAEALASQGVRGPVTLELHPSDYAVAFDALVAGKFALLPRSPPSGPSLGYTWEGGPIAVRLVPRMPG